MQKGIEVAAANGMVWLTVGDWRVGLPPENAVELSAAIDEAIDKATRPSVDSDFVAGEV